VQVPVGPAFRGCGGRCPFLALSEQQSPAKRGKGRHKAKPKNGQFLRGVTQTPAHPSKGRQSAANEEGLIRTAAMQGRGRCRSVRINLVELNRVARTSRLWGL